MIDLPKSLSHALSIATGNIARFQKRLESESNPVDRNMLECTLALEREKLALLTVQARVFSGAKRSSPKADGGKP